MTKKIYEASLLKLIMMTFMSVLLASMLYMLAFINYEIDIGLLFLSTITVLGASNILTLLLVRLIVKRRKELEESD